MNLAAVLVAAIGIPLAVVTGNAVALALHARSLIRDNSLTASLPAAMAYLAGIRREIS